MRRKGGQALQAEETAQAKTWHLDQQFSGAGIGKRRGGGEGQGCQEVKEERARASQ